MTTYARPENRGKGRNHKEVQFPLMAEHITAGIPDDVHHCALAKALTGVLMGDPRYAQLDLHSVTVKVDDSGRSGQQLVVWAAWDWTETIVGEGERRRHSDAEIEPREAAVYWACLNDIASKSRTRKLASQQPVDGQWFTATDIHSRLIDTRVKAERTAAERKRQAEENQAFVDAVSAGQPGHEEPREIEVNFTATQPSTRRRQAPRKARRTSRRFGVR